ncbi:hypothetical protein AMS68_001116 [Peltaster fructicola]|uniref:Transferrin receptor-like dimerisation domain-containing protein n=1 Tax=Peltaster fructicola TaxID=286661 RepID=A0A6H0XLU3_9PEZI|nr:hypothetical protein AMS68_001116 [Peltaster fructicola]
MSHDAALSHLIPIPTYEEAISRPSSSHTGPTETSHDAQRQGYRPPAVESARTSLESDLSVPEMQAIEELDYLEPGQTDLTLHRSRIRSKFSQRLSDLTATLGALRIPSLRRLYTTIPATDETPAEEPVESWRSRLNRSLHVPEQYRMSVPTLARLCALLTIAGLLWFLFSLNFFRRRGMAPMFDPEAVRGFVLSQVNGGRIRGWLDHLSSFAHEAGTEGDYYMAEWMLSEWNDICALEEKGLLEYSIMANYPKPGGRYVKTEDWTAALEENEIDMRREQTLAWHGYSTNGKAQGPLLYVNYGSRDDYRYLHNKNITTAGAIALVRTGGSQTGLKIRFAQEAGCIGVLVFNGDDMDASRAPLAEMIMPSNDSVHRANAVMSNWLLGDPLTPGYASTRGSRKDHEAAAKVLPTIPSLPISWRDASVLLSKLQGRGARVDAEWQPGDAYTGSAIEGVVVEMQNDNDVVDSETTWQVRARMDGQHPELTVVVGAPRDSWCFGASHSASASAVLTEIIAVFGELRRQGWRPARNIEFVSWDANTFNTAGSTEYVEDNFQALRDTGIAYINVGEVSELSFRASGSPMLHRTLSQALHRVNAPGTEGSLADHFDGPGGMDKLGDAAAFTYIAGMPSLNMIFEGEQGRLAEGSCYDTMNRLFSVMADDDLPWHTALAQVFVLVVLDLASAPLLSLDSRTFAEDFAKAVDDFEKDALSTILSPGQAFNDVGIDTAPLHDAVSSLRNASTSFHAFEDQWTAQVLAQGGMEDLYQNRQRVSWNNQLVQFEKALIDVQKHKDDGTPGGLKDRPQFRHILVAPRKWEDGVRSLPTIWEYLEDKEWEKANKEIIRVAAMVEAAAEPLSTGW